MSEIKHVQDPWVKTFLNNVLTELYKHYPLYHHGWRIKVDTRKQGGVVTIQNELLSGQMGMTLHLNKIDPELKAVTRAAGELLERYRQSRAKNGNIVDRLNELRVNRIGRAVHDT